MVHVPGSTWPSFCFSIELGLNRWFGSSILSKRRNELCPSGEVDSANGSSCLGNLVLAGRGSTDCSCHVRNTVPRRHVLESHRKGKQDLRGHFNLHIETAKIFKEHWIEVSRLFQVRSHLPHGQSGAA